MSIISFNRAYKQNGIKHTVTLPYPASNNAVERCVQIVKQYWCISAETTAEDNKLTLVSNLSDEI